MVPTVVHRFMTSEEFCLSDADVQPPMILKNHNSAALFCAILKKKYVQGGVVMRCVFCNEPAGFLKSYHDACYQKVQALLNKMEKIVNEYNQETIHVADAKKELISIALSSELYQNYVRYEIFNITAIRTNETIVYVESGLNISESKNRCRMVETGYRYEKKPVWTETDNLIGSNVSVAMTDKSVYLLIQGKAMMYPYGKIVNLGYDEKCGYAYFDVKTASPYPHRFSISSLNRKDKNKAGNVCLFLKCLMGY